MRLIQNPCARLLGACVVAAAAAACGARQSSPVAQTPPAPPPSPAPSAAAARPSPAVKLDVPYVPTPTAVVARMLERAKVGRGDLVYDLGSGDGRIVVTAAKKRGARGVGYDIDPERIREANENARRAGVADRVRFVEGDLFEADLSGATVVTLYLLPDINLRLRPKLLRELRPGTRVVSHNYPMGDWEPESVEEVDVEGGTHYVYYWVIPSAGAKVPTH